MYGRFTADMQLSATVRFYLHTFYTHLLSQSVSITIVIVIVEIINYTVVSLLLYSLQIGAEFCKNLIRYKKDTLT